MSTKCPDAICVILRRLGAGALAVGALLVVTSTLPAQEAGSAAVTEEVPKPLPKVPHPKDNPPTPAKIALGRQLYWDTRLSRDNSISCASCHDPQKGWSNGEQFATGVEGQKGGRNSPTIINVAYNKFQFWDGRAGSLEEQAVGPIHNPIEMAMNKQDREVVQKLNAIEGYRRQFLDVFGTDATLDGITKAIAAYERTVLAGDAPYDRYKAGDKDALSEPARRGMEIFFNKAVCSGCHSGPNFTDNAFHNVGVGWDQENPDLGRYNVIKLGGFKGAFKTPTLRDIAKTAPYMHNGSMKTLEQVVEHYNQGGVENPYLSEDIFPLNLTEQEKKDLVTFLKEGLASNVYPMDEAPELPK